MFFCLNASRKAARSEALKTSGYCAEGPPTFTQFWYEGEGFSSYATYIQTFKTKSNLLLECISTFVLLLTLQIVVFRAEELWEPSWSLFEIQKTLI